LGGVSGGGRAKAGGGKAGWGRADSGGRRHIEWGVWGVHKWARKAVGDPSGRQVWEGALVVMGRIP